MSWTGFTPLAPVCVDCGAAVAPWTADAPLDWRDADEEQRGRNALAIQAHRYEHHRVEPAIGDLVTYSAPWRGHVLESAVFRVTAIHSEDHHAFAREMRGDDLAPLLGIKYGLVNPHRSNDYSNPFVGDPRRPITFRLVSSAPPVQVDLMDLLGWEP